MVYLAAPSASPKAQPVSPLGSTYRRRGNVDLWPQLDPRLCLSTSLPITHSTMGTTHSFEIHPSIREILEQARRCSLELDPKVNIPWSVTAKLSNCVQFAKILNHALESSRPLELRDELHAHFQADDEICERSATEESLSCQSRQETQSSDTSEDDNQSSAGSSSSQSQQSDTERLPSPPVQELQHKRELLCSFRFKGQELSEDDFSHLYSELSSAWYVRRREQWNECTSWMSEIS